MKAPKLPSFFKVSTSRSFSFKPRYYNKRKERRESMTKADKSSLIFEYKKRNHSLQKGRGYQIIFLIIILSLLAYKLLII